MRYLNQRSVPDIARELGRTEGCVESMLHVSSLSSETFCVHAALADLKQT